MPHAPYLQSLKTLFHRYANPLNAGPMKKYMRDQFEFLGIKAPQVSTLFKQFSADHGLPEYREVNSHVRELWKWQEREFQYVAIALLGKFQKQLTPDAIPLLKHLIIHKSWWDTVDALASHKVGGLLLKFPEIQEQVISQWANSKNIWLRRTTLIFQLRYKFATDESLLYALIRANKSSSEFFIQKAIGWALREYSKTNPESVQAFVRQGFLAPLSQREALKWMKGRGML